MGRFVFLAIALVSLSACKKEKAQGLPPAQEWSANTNTLPPAPGATAANPHGNGPAAANPHGGGDPHAGMNMGNPHGGGDPHAGLDMNGGGGGSVPPLPPPDPNRKIDPNQRVSGTIKIHPKAKDRVKAGGAVFITIKAAGPDGAPSGPPLAVDKLTWDKDELKFTMTEAQSMIAGTKLEGDVVVTVRFDQDSDALSKQPGDVVGTARVKVPADNVNVTLDEILP